MTPHWPGNGFARLREATLALKRWQPPTRILLRVEREEIERRSGYRRRVSEQLDIWIGQQRWRAKAAHRWVIKARPVVLVSGRFIDRHRRALILVFIVAVSLIVPSA